LFAHPQRFPRGIKALADYVHGLGLKFGLYSSRGVTTCAGLPGSQDFEVLDARTFAEWGVDFLKYDNCPYDVTQQEIINRYRLMRDALRQTGRPIIYGIIGGGFQHWYPEIAHLNRTAGDIQDNWGVVVHRFDVNAAAAPFARPGFWNDPDVLETGTGGMTPLEYRSQFSLWALSAAPLILSIDLERMNGYTLATLTNREVIAVNQDALGVQAVKISEDAPGLQVWAKRINRRGTWAIALFNRTEASADITVRWTDVGVLTGKANIRDLWTGQSGMYADQFKTMVVSHGVTLIKVCGVPKDTQVAGACG
jgi:alpha-galactosidase